MDLNNLKTIKCALIKRQAVLEIYDYCKKINYVEIGATNETKASGLIELSKILNIPIEEILVFGDGDNDLEMLSKFPNSVCMCNGTENAKILSKYITKRDNNNSGVAEGINYYIGGD